MSGHHEDRLCIHCGYWRREHVVIHYEEPVDFDERGSENRVWICPTNVFSSAGIGSPDSAVESEADDE